MKIRYNKSITNTLSRYIDPMTSFSSVTAILTLKCIIMKSIVVFIEMEKFKTNTRVCYAFLV